MTSHMTFKWTRDQPTAQTSLSVHPMLYGYRLAISDTIVDSLNLLSFNLELYGL